MTKLAEKIIRNLAQRPRQFAELVDLHHDIPWRTFLKAWGEVRAAEVLMRDEDGRYFVESDGADDKAATAHG